MKIAWTTDAHVGNYGKRGGPIKAGINQRCEDVLKALRWTVTHAEKAGCACYIHCGDLFDYERVEPQVVARVQQELTLPTALLVGNHDQKSTAYRDHALAPLSPVALLVDTEPYILGDCDLVDVGDDTEVMIVPFQPGRAEDWLPEVIRNHLTSHTFGGANTRVLALHLGISDSKTPYYLDSADDSVCIGTVEKLCQEFGFTHVFAGNWHIHKRWTVEGLGGTEVAVVQIGTMAPNRFSDVGGRYGTMALLDTMTGKVEIVDVPGPRFIKCASLKEVEDLIKGNTYKDTVALANPLYVSARVSPDEVAAVTTSLEEGREGALAGVLRHYEVHVDRSTEDAQTQKAVAGAVDASTQDDALRAYVAETPFAGDVPHEDIQQFIDECLKEARSC